MLSVVIPTYNAEDTLGELLEALAEQRSAVPWEAIVVDDASTDGSIGVAEAYRCRMRLRVVRCASNGGAARARNLGVLDAHGDMIGFVDADDVVAPGWLDAAVCALRRDVAAASRFDVDALNDARIRSSRRGPQQNGLQAYTSPPYLPHCGGSGLLVRRSAHEAIGGFDESLRYLEDTDYAWRLQLAGFRLAFAPDAVVRVRYRASGIASARQAYRYGFYNVVLYTRYRTRGMPALSWRRGVRAWLRLLSPGSLADLTAPDRRRAWMRRAGWQLGRLAASARLGVWAL